MSADYIRKEKSSLFKIFIQEKLLLINNSIVLY